MHEANSVLFSDLEIELEGHFDDFDQSKFGVFSEVQNCLPSLLRTITLTLFWYFYVEVVFYDSKKKIHQS